MNDEEQPVKRPRGRPRKDGLPPGSAPARTKKAKRKVVVRGIHVPTDFKR